MKLFDNIKNWSKTKKIIISIIAILLVLIIGAASYLLIAFKYNYNDLGGATKEELGVTDTNLPDGVTNIALFGVDSRDGKFTGNTDSIMILSVDTIHKKIKVVSVMRDSLVKIEGYTPFKINSAYAKGGPKLAIKTLNQNFNMNISEYATINFNGMSKIIDAVGGIDAELTEREVKDANIHLKYMAIEQNVEATYIEGSGEMHLNGLQAVAFSRVRHVPTIDGVADDYGRTDRQRLVMKQLFYAAVNLSNAKLTKLIKTSLPFVETSLNYVQIVKLAGALRIKGIDFVQTRIPQNDYVINGGFAVNKASTVYFNLEYAAKVLHAYIYDDISYEDYKAQNGVDKTEWYNVSDYSKNKVLTDDKSQAKGDSNLSSYYQLIENEYKDDDTSSQTVNSEASEDISSQSSTSTETDNTESDLE